MNSRMLYFAVHGVKPPRRSPRRRAGRGPARSYKYRAWIRSQPSVVSGVSGCEAAHTGSDGGMAQKASDYSCVPLSAEEHREYHRIGREEFELLHGIDFSALVRSFNRAWFGESREVK